jgi:hypothetical protein
MDEMPEERLRAGEDRPANHDHEGVGLTEESLSAHLTLEHETVVPEGLSFGALRGMHDRFHGEAHATDDQGGLAT